MTANIEERMAKIFMDLFDVPRDILHVDANQDAIDKWDSLRHLTLITTIENEFGVAFDAQDIVDLISFGLACEIVKEKLML